MLSNSSAANPAEWWQLVLMALVLFGMVLLVVDVALGFLRWTLRGIGFMLNPRTYQNVYVSVVSAERPDGEHRDPTRPRAWDDVEGKVIVAERMRYLDKPHKP